MPPMTQPQEDLKIAFRETHLDIIQLDSASIYQ